MKMVRGITLRKVLELLAEGVAETVAKCPLPALLTIFQKVCDALAFAHSRGVIHRDLKPENIMLDDFGVVLVMDWGLAKLVGGSSESRAVSPTPAAGEAGLGSPAYVAATLAGTIMGTPAFMSSEQARGGGGGPRRPQRPLCARRDPLPNPRPAPARHRTHRDGDRG